MFDGLTFKDFISLIGTVITVAVGYMLISVQVRKNRRAKWIEDFRREAAHFIWLNTPTYDHVFSKVRDPKRQNELIATAILVRLFLDTRIESHKVLYEMLSSNIWAFQHSPVAEISNLKEIALLVEEILRAEQKKI